MAEGHCAAHGHSPAPRSVRPRGAVWCGRTAAAAACAASRHLWKHMRLEINMPHHHSPPPPVTQLTQVGVWGGWRKAPAGRTLWGRCPGCQGRHGGGAARGGHRLCLQARRPAGPGRLRCGGATAALTAPSGCAWGACLGTPSTSICRLGSWRSASPRHARQAALLAGPPAILHACVLVLALMPSG
jgi:hypothetical protein